MRLVGSVLYDADELVSAMVAARISHVGPAGFGGRDPATNRLPYAALGVVRGDTLLGGVVFHHYLPQSGVIEMSGAFDRADWCRPATLRHLFSYPFGQLNCQNLITITGKKNERARRLDEFLGFKVVGTIKRGLDGKEDAVIYQMPREYCRWIKDKA